MLTLPFNPTHNNNILLFKKMSRPIRTAAQFAAFMIGDTIKQEKSTRQTEQRTNKIYVNIVN